jgi:hypothetical protein
MESGCVHDLLFVHRGARVKTLRESKALPLEMHQVGTVLRDSRFVFARVNNCKHPLLRSAYITFSWTSSWESNCGLGTSNQLAEEMAQHFDFLDLDPSLYPLDSTPEDLEFFKQQTGIDDKDELKNHVLAEQAEAYKVAYHVYYLSSIL